MNTGDETLELLLNKDALQVIEGLKGPLGAASRAEVIGCALALARVCAEQRGSDGVVAILGPKTVRHIQLQREE